MNDHNERKQPRSRVKSNSPKYVIVFLVLAALLTAAFYFYMKATASRSLPVEIVASEQLSDNLQTSITTESDNPINQTDLSDQATIIPSEKSALSNHNSSISSEKSEGTIESLSSTSATGQRVNDAQPLIEDINNFYSHLDNQVYMKTYKLEASSKDHFSSLLQKLLKNPPVVTRETDDLFTLLKNTAHFFRVLGKNNILMLKGILDREKDSFEKILKSFFTLTNYPEDLKKEYSLSIPADSLYDYSGFFLNTMGGRLYLFRRDSTSRMMVSFYAILIIDREKDAGNDRHGLDLMQPINSLIDEIENAGKRLRLKDEYLDILYELKEKYSY